MGNIIPAITIHLKKTYLILNWNLSISTEVSFKVCINSHYLKFVSDKIHGLEFRIKCDISMLNRNEKCLI